MATGVRRVGGVSEAEQTYTLGPEESFRLDACSFTVGFANEGGFVIPTLIARDSGGVLVDEIAAPALQISPPSRGPIAYSGPAAFSDTIQLLPPDGYAGYSLHDFGAPVTTSQVTMTWTQPPGQQADGIQTWLSSPGAVAMGPIIGTQTVENTDSVTVALTSGIAAGHHLLLHLTLLAPQNWINPTAPMLPVVTDSKGGNGLDPVAGILPVWCASSLQRPDGLYLSSWIVLWRIVNPLVAGDTVTLTNVRGDAFWMQLDANDVTGLTAGAPVGGNPGSNYVQIGRAPGTSPDTSVAAPTPKWTGPVFFNSAYLIPDGGVANVQLSRGGVEIMPVSGFAAQGSTTYVQAPLPDALRLGPQDTLTATCFDTLGQRVGDTIRNFLVYGVPE